MNAFTVWKDEATDTYTIEIDGEIKYECLADDEMEEIVKELLKKERAR